MRISDWSSDVCSSDLGVPFGRTNVAGDLASLAVEQQRRRQAHGIQLLRGFAAFVDVASEAFDTYLGVEGVDDSHAGPIDGKRDNLEIGPAERCLQPVEGRHFLPAGPAPGGPEVEQHQRSEEHTSELQSLMRISSAVC